MELNSKLLNQILQNYHNCDLIDDCNKCKANSPIFGCDTEKGIETFCDFLRAHGIICRKEIFEVVNKVL